MYKFLQCTGQNKGAVNWSTTQVPAGTANTMMHTQSISWPLVKHISNCQHDIVLVPHCRHQTTLSTRTYAQGTHRCNKANRTKITHDKRRVTNVDKHKLKRNNAKRWATTPLSTQLASTLTTCQDNQTASRSTLICDRVEQLQPPTWQPFV